MIVLKVELAKTNGESKPFDSVLSQDKRVNIEKVNDNFFYHLKKTFQEFRII